MSSVGLAQRPLEDGRRVDGRVVGDAIHHHLAEDRPDAVRLGRPERGVHGGLVDDAVGQHGRRAGGREGLEDGRREPLGDGRIRPRPLGREGQPVEPGQQVEREADPGVRHLRQVGVEVDHAGQDDPRPKVDRGDQHVPWRRGRRSDPGDPAGGVDVDERVRFVAHATRRQRRQQPRPKRERRSLRKLAARHRRRLARGPVPLGLTWSQLLAVDVPVRNVFQIFERGSSRIPTRSVRTRRDHAQISEMCACQDIHRVGRRMRRPIRARNRARREDGAARRRAEQGSERTPRCVSDRRSEQRTDAPPTRRD